MSEQNKAIAARIPLEAFNQGKLEVIDEVIADNSVDHGTRPPGVPAGKEGIKVLAKSLRSAFPDLKIVIDLQVAEGDLVVQHATSTGTMKGEFAGMPRAVRPRNGRQSISAGSRTARSSSTGRCRTSSACSSSWASCPRRRPRPRADRSQNRVGDGV